MRTRDIQENQGYKITRDTGEPWYMQENQRYTGEPGIYKTTSNTGEPGIYRRTRDTDEPWYIQENQRYTGETGI